METNTFPIDIHLAKLLGILIYNFKIKYLILLILNFCLLLLRLDT